jgi:hypothetical protein
MCSSLHANVRNRLQPDDEFWYVDGWYDHSVAARIAINGPWDLGILAKNLQLTQFLPPGKASPPAGRRTS